MNNKKINRKQGHWVLAKMGKKVLRPGGKELTLKMLENLQLNFKDHVVEFAPGLGFTAQLTLNQNPKSYTAIELNEKAAKLLGEKIKGPNKQIIIGNAADTGLTANLYTKVYGEAMLTMQPDKCKSVIIGEAHRILKTGGRYGIHELGLMPNDIDENIKKEIHLALAQSIKVNARPLTQSEWVDLLEQEGFKILNVSTNPMHLLEINRVIDDEGFWRSLKIIWNVMTHPKERKQILAMRRVFRKYKQHLNAISIVAEKIEKI